MTSDTFIFNYAPVFATVLTQNGRLKNKDSIFVCLNFYATVRCKKALSERQLQGMPRSAARRFFETYRCIGKRCKTFRSAPLMQRYPVFMPISCPMRSRRHLVFMNVVTSTFARHSLNARNVINWERNFKENIIKNT